MAVRYEPEGRVALITLDRPEALNTFDRAMHIELHDAWCAFRDDAELSVAIVTGAGDRAFSAGADVRSWGRTEDETRPHPHGPGPREAMVSGLPRDVARRSRQVRDL